MKLRLFFAVSCSFVVLGIGVQGLNSEVPQSAIREPRSAQPGRSVVEPAQQTKSRNQPVLREDWNDLEVALESGTPGALYELTAENTKTVFSLEVWTTAWKPVEYLKTVQTPIESDRGWAVGVIELKPVGEQPQHYRVILRREDTGWKLFATEIL